ncbi:MAG: MSMEG_1061 family FMN-dependent PPOX-type flavoprotein [Myxococcota bacterium]
MRPTRTPDPHRIETVADLRNVVGEALPGGDTKVLTELDDFARAFIARSPFLVLSTADAEGHQDASPKGDAPGFVLVEDARTIVIPDRPGNRLVMGHLNILSQPGVGVIMMVPGTPETFRINGRAELTRDPELLEKLAARGRPAVLGIRIEIDECFFHCAKAFIRSNLWKPEKWGDRHRVSFGEMFAAQSGAEKEVAENIDRAISADYQDNL